jgi:hypothetical protein
MKTPKTIAQAKRVTFTKDEIWSAAMAGKYPPGMTAQDLISARCFDLKNKRHFTALHVAAERSRFPPGTTFQDLLSASRGKLDNCVLAVFSFKNRKTTNRWPKGTTAKDLAAAKDQVWGSFLVRSAVQEPCCYPPGTTTEDLKICNQYTSLQFAAMFGNLLPGTTARDLKSKVEIGKRPWWHALKLLSGDDMDPEVKEICVRNLLACPELAGELDLQNNEMHREILTCVLASPKMTPALRAEMAKYPTVNAAML